MRAVRFTAFGEPQDVLRVEDISLPEPGPGEVRVPCPQIRGGSLPSACKRLLRPRCALPRNDVAKR